jgi:signal transduction histidine kinase
LYRIAQEAVNNALKHSNATRIEVRLDRSNDTLELSVRDFGKGLTPEAPNHGLGMQTMRHRAQLIGGKLTVLNAPDGGAQIICLLKQTWTTPQSPTSEQKT